MNTALVPARPNQAILVFFERHAAALLPGPSSTFPPLILTMISDNELYSLAVFLGSLAMLLIILYHFLEVNAIDENNTDTFSTQKVGAKGGVQGVQRDRMVTPGRQ